MLHREKGSHKDLPQQGGHKNHEDLGGDPVIPETFEGGGFSCSNNRGVVPTCEVVNGWLMGLAVFFSLPKKSSVVVGKNEPRGVEESGYVEEAANVFGCFDRQKC